MFYRTTVKTKVQSNDAKTVVTTIVDQVSRVHRTTLFRARLERGDDADHNVEVEMLDHEIDNAILHHNDSESMHWGSKPTRQEDGRKLYSSVIIDGVRYMVSIVVPDIAYR